MSSGLVIGKFLPLHNGHLYLLDTASQSCDDLTIVVCSLSNEPISGLLRVKWVKEAFPNAKVLHLNDDSMPQEPGDSINFWDIWRNSLRKLHPEKIDILFSSESYGERLSEELNCIHRCVDISRNTVSISATEIRNNPIKNWEFIPNHVKPFFAKKVMISGPESTGKTTLAENLSKYFNTVYTPEYAREYLSEKLYDFDIYDLCEVAKKQYENQVNDLKTANKIYFSDTSALETDLYSKMYLGKSCDPIRLYLDLQKEFFDVALLLSPETEWVEDKLRDINADRWKFFNDSQDLLNKMKFPYYIISGNNFQERTDKAIEVCEKLLKEPMKGISK